MVDPPLSLSRRTPTGHSRHHGLSAGFTLIEITMVLVIATLLISAGLHSLSVVRENADRAETAKTLQEIQAALYAYAVSYGRLPCPGDPAVGSGDEDKGGAGGYENCQREVGILPWNLALTETSGSLGVKPLDAWGNWFTYHVSGRDDGVVTWADGKSNLTFNLGTECSGSITPVSATVALCTQANIVVREGAAGTALANGVAAVVISHGRDGVGAFSPNHNRYVGDVTADQAENYDDLNDNGTQVTTRDRLYVSRDLGQVEGDEFDDMMIWINPMALKRKWVEAELLPD